MADLIRPDDLKKISSDAEMAKAQEYLKRAKRDEEEQKSLREAFLDRDLHPEVRDRVNAAIRRAAEQGNHQLQVITFPASYCNDGGRRINNAEPDWPDSLEGFAKRAYAFYVKELQPLGYAEYEAFLAGHAQRTLAQARNALGDGAPAEFIWRSASSATEGLATAAAETGAGFVVLGSARHGPLGRFTIGSVTHDIFYAVSVPVVLAPRGYHSPPPQAQLKRLTCIYVPSPGSRAALDAAVRFCRAHVLPLRIATLVVRDKQMYPSGAGYKIENLVSNVWKTQAAEAQEKVLVELPPDLKVTTVIGDGPDWKKALDSLAWEDAELLVIGSRVQSTMARLLLGPNSARIIRSSPVPVVVVPRPAADD